MEQLTSSSLEKPPRILEASPPFVGHHGYKLQREQTSSPRPGAEDLETTAVHWNRHVLGTERNRSLCFHTSVLTLLACKPSNLDILEP